MIVLFCFILNKKSVSKLIMITKLTWKFLVQFNYKNPPKICLGRSPEVTKQYNDHKQKLINDSIDINTYISNKYFSKSNQTLFIEYNAFPYNCAENIKHYVMWINLKDNHIKDKFLTEFKLYICNTLFNGDESKMDDNCVYYQNIPEQRSIKGIPHLQIFVRT